MNAFISKRYRVVLTWRGREWRGVVPARNVDEAIRTAKARAEAPEEGVASETQRIDGGPV